MNGGDWMELRPRRLLGFEEGPEGRVVVLRPKVLSPRWRWLLRLLRKPVYRVKLDARGSFVWLQCDGAVSIGAIARRTQAQFGDPESDSDRRTALFIQELARGGFLVLDPAEDQAHGT